MKLLSATPYRNWVYLGLLVQIVAAWFSIGYHHPDEHFQVLEFCNYKLGRSPACDLPWEFAAQARPCLQPFIAYGLGRGLQVLGMYNPFTLAFLLRLMMGLLTWFVTRRIVTLLLPDLVTNAGKKALVWCGFFLWFVPYIGVRFSAENISGLFLFLAISFLLCLNDYPYKKQLQQLIVVGLLLGFALFIRIQIALALAGLCCWLLWYQKWPLRNWIVLTVAGLIAIMLCVCIDHWFYGAWVFTPWNYFDQNIFHHVAAKFGVDPWWYYFTKFLDIGVPPISVVLLPIFFVGIRQKPLHLFTWIIILFVAGHSFIGHKEIRFLFPVSIAFIFLACAGFDRIVQKYPDRKVFRWAIPSFAALNTIMLAIKIFTPAHEAMKYYEVIYNYSQNQYPVLISTTESPFKLVGLCINFYQPRHIEEQTVATREQLDTILHNAAGRPVLFFNSHLAPDPILRNFRTEKVYCILPGWMNQFDFTDWQSRSYIWTIYRVYPL